MVISLMAEQDELSAVTGAIISEGENTLQPPKIDWYAAIADEEEGIRAIGIDLPTGSNLVRLFNMWSHYSIGRNTSSSGLGTPEEEFATMGASTREEMVIKTREAIILQLNSDPVEIYATLKEMKEGLTGKRPYFDRNAITEILQSIFPESSLEECQKFKIEFLRRR